MGTLRDAFWPADGASRTSHAFVSCISVRFNHVLGGSLCIGAASTSPQASATVASITIVFVIIEYRVFAALHHAGRVRGERRAWRLHPHPLLLLSTRAFVSTRLPTMTAHVPVTRVPFAPLDNPRLQHLASAKNRQNGMPAIFGRAASQDRILTCLGVTSQKPALGGKAISSLKSVLSSGKRPFEPCTLEDVDTENMDPAVFGSPSKKSKSDVFDKPLKPFTFSPTPTTSMPPPASVPSRLSTPTRANISSPRTPLTAPAGRSPKRKVLGVSKNRRISAPFSRIDPPFSSRASSSLPFSLDAALSGTFGIPTSASAGATIQESMPKDWFFDIYEDSPEEEASNLMEHSTLTLDLSSDDESTKQQRDRRGKENTPPDDYDASTASRSAVEPAVSAPQRISKTDIIRRKVVNDDMDDGQRSPLCDLETDPLIPEGLNKDSHVFVPPTPEKSAAAPAVLDLKDLFTAPAPFSAAYTKKSSAKSTSLPFCDTPVAGGKADLKGEIIVWEDSPLSEQCIVANAASFAACKADQAKRFDENTAPVA